MYSNELLFVHLLRSHPLNRLFWQHKTDEALQNPVHYHVVKTTANADLLYTILKYSCNYKSNMLQKLVSVLIS